ncbi:hypothetical protein BWQ96_04591 [Gracilariopsis chorda]|uniref:Uncharacterized protein n=1 Tax=Gracilariopsis chorda TaxID=448386 RepID=A0A2V3IVF3_9FLOR|nr:hypothetical protein BWQ96_04591 [Gracilariopsis chorda]|eukprot:PXF45687.1 hypothetical protein BWQ96_04591 [Gracilariopsis chorda]
MKAGDVIRELASRDKTCEDPQIGEVRLKRSPGKDKGKAKADIDIAQCALSDSHADETAAAQTTYGPCASENRAKQENAPLPLPRIRALMTSSSVGLRISDK